MARKKISKTKRIQAYIGSNPEARNREIVEALSAHSVTAADVSNAKSQLKKKQLTESSEAPATPATPATSSKRTPRTRVSSASKGAAKNASGNTISVEELELTAGYIQAVGGLDRVQQLLQMVQQIQAL